MLDVGKFSEPKQQKNDLGGPTENTFSHHINSCDGQVVKALDLKSNGYYPRRFKSCSPALFKCDGGEFKAKWVHFGSNPATAIQHLRLLQTKTEV